MAKIPRITRFTDLFSIWARNTHRVITLIAFSISYIGTIVFRAGLLAEEIRVKEIVFLAIFTFQGVFEAILAVWINAWLADICIIVRAIPP